MHLSYEQGPDGDFQPEQSLKLPKPEDVQPTNLQARAGSDLSRFSIRPPERHRPSASYSYTQGEGRRARPRSIAEVERPELFGKETLVLLAKYFADALEKGESALLAGQLLFPQNDEAAALYAKKIEKALSEKEDALLKALALYPQDRELALLKQEQILGKQELTLEQQTALYVGLNPSGSKKEDRALQKKLVKELSPFHGEEVNPANRATALTKFAKRELASRPKHISTDEELGALFQATPDEVREILEDRDFGLSDDELRTRTERLILNRNNGEQALSTRLYRAVRTFASIENEMYRNNAIDTPSRRKYLQELFGVSRDKVNRCMRFLYSDDLYTREQAFGREDHHQRKRDIAETVLRELRDFELEKVDSIRSSSELAAEFGVEGPSVEHYLTELLPPETRHTRQLVLRRLQKGEEFMSSPLEYVRTELEAFRKGEIELIRGNEHLADLFQVSSSTIEDQLTPVNGGLDEREFRDREFALALQASQTRPDIALKTTYASYVTEMILKQRELQDIGDGGWSPEKLIKLPCDSYEGLAVALEFDKHFPDWSIVPGETIEVEIGNRRIDFFFPSERLFVEYHPILKYHSRDGRGEIESRDEYQQYRVIKEELGSASESLAKRYGQSYENLLLQKYRAEREAVIASDPRFRDCRLKVLTDKQDVYRFLTQYGVNVGSEQAFNRRFRLNCGKIKAARETEAAA